MQNFTASSVFLGSIYMVGSIKDVVIVTTKVKKWYIASVDPKNVIQVCLKKWQPWKLCPPIFNFEWPHMYWQRYTVHYFSKCCWRIGENKDVWRILRTRQRTLLNAFNPIHVLWRFSLFTHPIWELKVPMFTIFLSNSLRLIDMLGNNNYTSGLNHICEQVYLGMWWSKNNCGFGTSSQAKVNDDNSRNHIEPHITRTYVSN